MAIEVRSPPPDADGKAGGRRPKTVVGPPQDVLERLLRLEKRCGGFVDMEDRRHDFVMERRHDDLDAVVDDYLELAEHVLLRRQNPGRSGVGPRKPVD